MTDAAEIYRVSFLDGLRPDPFLTVSEWADAHRYLSQKASAEPGRWRTDRTPYLREPMDCLSPSSPIQRVVMIAGAQIGKTETGNNWFGYVVHHAPGPMLMVQPTVDLAKRLSKQRIASMIDESPVLRERIAESRSRDSGNTQLSKEFQGGVLVITGANSAVGLRSMPVRYLFCDEVDAWPSDVDGEGDPLKLAERRTTTFARRKILITSTPTIKDVSRVEREFLLSDQRRYYVPCPHCGNMDWIRWANIRYDEGNPASARLLCELCGVFIEEHYKTEMLLRGQWRATAPGNGVTAGFHISSLYSPLGWKSWADIVREFLAAKGDPSLLKEWVNTVLGESWEEQYSARIESESIAERAEEYDLYTVPTGGLLLTAGVDVQDNRLAVVVRAWGRDEESWLVNWAEIHGDPADLSPTGPWAQVESLLSQDFMHESGVKLRIKAMAVDTGGHFTNEAYVFCRKLKRMGVFAIKGSSTPGKTAIGKPSRQDVNYKNQVIKKGVDLWLIGTDTIKATIYGRLKAGKASGAGVYHFPLGVVIEYYKQLTAEKQVTRYVKGFPKREWIKKDGARNEALDCEVYAYAALQFFYTRTNRANLWLNLEKIIGKLTPPVIAEDDKPVESPVPIVQPKKFLQPRRRGTSFIKGWR